LAADGPRVNDFGIARAVDGSRMTQTGVGVGSLREHDAPPLRGGDKQRSALLPALRAGMPVHSVARGSDRSAIRPDGIRSANS
ncbi:hypothetical protein ACFV25_30110, partial [Streptomyces sp. NPDC059715]